MGLVALFATGPVARADERAVSGVRALLLSQAGAAEAAATGAKGDDEPPRIAPIPRRDPAAEAAAAEKKRQEELAALPAYKRWWFWALAGAVVAGTAVLAVTLIDSEKNPARGCMAGSLACFGDGR